MNSTSSSPFTCMTCNTGYYQSNGVCVAVSSSISNCYIYDSASTCANCTSPYVLSLSKTACLTISSADTNCFNMQLNAAASCSICN